MAAKFIQTSLEVEQYKSLKIAAVHMEMSLGDLLRDITLNWLNARKEKEDGRRQSKTSTEA